MEGNKIAMSTKFVNRIDRTDPEYVKALVEKKPHKEDPKEIAITQKIKSEVLREPWAHEAFRKIDGLQREYLREMIANVDNADLVHSRTQEALAQISLLLQSEIEEGREILGSLHGESMLLATNHLGAYKLLPLSPQEDLGVDIPGYDTIYPYLSYFAALDPVAKEIGDSLYYVSDDFPLVFGEIHREAGFINVPPAKIVSQGRTAMLEEQTAILIRNHPNALIVNYPEGGTSGKYTGKGPYDLDPFQTGCYVIASHLDMPVLPVAQYFDSKKGMRLKIFDPVRPEVGDRATYEKYAEQHRAEMQDWLDKKKQAA